MNRPPDRSHIDTERRNANSHGLHQRSVAECLRILDGENQSVIEALAAAEPAMTAFLTAAETGFLAGGRLIYLGAGTSGRLGVLDASEVPPTFQVPHGRVVALIAGGDGALRKSSEGLEDDPEGAVAELQALHPGHRDAVLGIAAGGTTPYVLGGLTWTARLNDRPLTAMMTCARIDRPADVDHLIVLPTGPEVLTGSTRLKAGSATKMALNAISTTLMIRAGKVYDNLMVDLKASNAKLRDRAARIIASLLGCDRDRAFDLLDAGDGVVKVAVVMARRNVDREEAVRLLEAVHGHLDQVIETTG